ncbi:MAG: hypothetical protein MUO72_06875 [Bacteroidales bacterium]|nr:hypothetical protein [Bacteroidales bacterium]
MVISFISGSTFKFMVNKRLHLILFTLPFFNLLNFSQDVISDDRLLDIIKQKGQAEVIIAYSGRKETEYLSRNLSIASVEDKRIHIILSRKTVEWFIAQHYDYEIIVRDDAKGIVNSSDIKAAVAWETYPTYTQYDSIMQKFADDYPSLSNLDTIGTSINGKLILALKISDNAGNDEDEPEVFYASTMHGDETGGFILLLRLADYLLKNYTLSTRVRSLVDNLEIWINPLSNPDGTYGSGDTMTSPTRFNANGEDLNRNFPDPEEPGKILEKENNDMISFMRRHKFILSANFHSGAEVVNYPWDRWFRLHADDNWFYSISRSYADTVHKHSVSGYMTYLDDGVTNGYDWYKINGGRQDFVIYELHGREVTIELDYDYITPAAQLNSLWEYNWRSMLGYLENSLYGIHGFVRDAHTSAPVPARIFVIDHDKDSSHIYSDTLTGSFVRLIAPGTWDLLFTATGYQDVLLTNVAVVEGQSTGLLVEMHSDINSVDTSETPVPVLYPNPAKTIIKAVLPERQFGRINIKIFNSTGIKISDYYSYAMKGIPVEIDVRGLSGGVYTVIFTNTTSKITDKGRFVVLRR